MIIRIREYKSGGVVQCIRTTYDPASKRGKQEVVATFKEHSTPNKEELSRLEIDEREQLDEWLKAKRKAEDDRYIRNRPTLVTDVLESFVDGLTNDQSFKLMEPYIDAEKLYALLERLSKDLRKRGIKKPVKSGSKMESSETPIEKMINESQP